jgi:AAA+ ATPase superfamily predicted ATPase
VEENKTFFSILQVIAAGERKLGNIGSKIGLETRNITSFLQKLRDLGIIERQVPVFENRPEKSKKGLYFIRDHFLRFWFAYIFPYAGDLEMDRKNYVLNKIKKTWTEYCSLCFEQVCLEHARKNAPFSVLKAGRYWHRDLEIDGVLIGEDQISLIECKWRNEKTGLQVYKDLQNKKERIDQDLLKGKHINYIIYSKSGFTDDMYVLAGQKNFSLVSFEN